MDSHKDLMESKKSTIRKKIEVLACIIDEFVNFVHHYGAREDQDAWDLRVRMTTAEKVWDAYLDPITDCEPEQSEIWREACYSFDTVSCRSEYYHRALAKAHRILEEFHGKSKEIQCVKHENPNSTEKRADVKAEEGQKFDVQVIKLPVFSGGYNEWLGFRDSFETNIHENNAIGDIQKFNFLLSFLNGDPVEVISSFEVSAENYNKAWSALKNQYNDKIVQLHSRKIFDSAAMGNNSSDLRQAVNKISKHFRVLEEMDTSVKWDAPVVWSVYSKLNDETRAEFDQSFKYVSPTWKAMEEFLNDRCKALESKDSAE